MATATPSFENDPAFAGSVKVDMRSMRQKIMDPKTVSEINEMKDYPTMLMDWTSRTLGRTLRDIITVLSICGAIGWYAKVTFEALQQPTA